MKNLSINIKLVICCLLISSCDSMFFAEEVENTPISNFESVWKEFDEKYGLFEVKNIDWDSVHSVHRPKIDEASTDDKLYQVITEMMAGLNDSHVGLLPTNDNLPFYQSGVYGTIDSVHDFSLDIIKEQYLEEVKFADPFFTYGKLKNTNLGYIHIEGFSDLPKNLEAPLDEILSALANTVGIILDVRGGYGGEDLAGQYIAGRFASQKKLYMKSRVKAGSTHNDFTAYENWYVEPTGSFQYRKPLAVLTHRLTISARETFCLALKQIPNMTFVGDTTTGAFSNQINREMPNGWGYSLSIGEWRDHEGKSYEGLGLSPDWVILNTREELENNQDKALEKAIELLE